MAAMSNFVSFSNLKLQIGWWQHLGGINLVGLANTCCNSPVQVDNLSSFIFNGQKKGQFFFFLIVILDSAYFQVSNSPQMCSSDHDAKAST